MKPLISVVIPVYNRKKLVLEAISSVLEQDFENFEIVLIDDGSTDGIAYYLESLRLPIRVISKQRSGPARARNVGIREAQGKFVAFLDSDDLYLPGILRAQLDFLINNKSVPLVYTDQFIDLYHNSYEGERLEKTRFQLRQYTHEEKCRSNLPDFIQSAPIQISSVMIRKSLFDEVGLFNESLLFHEDLELWNRISEKYRFGYIDKPLAIYRAGKDPQHLLGEASKEYFESARMYIGIYKQCRNKRGLSDLEKKAIEESYKRIDNLEQLFQLMWNGAITEKEFIKRRKKIFN